jgi:membrane-bound metal-dependent hydrolase YbcI (DUF457 family)
MPHPIAHALVGASVVAALRPSPQSTHWKSLLIGACLGISPDLDYALNWFGISGGGWHHGFTHSVGFALLLGLIVVFLLREWKVRSLVAFSAATLSHALLDFFITDSRGMALWWPFSDHRYKLRLPNPIDYNWRNPSLWETSLDLLRIGLIELMIFGPILLVVVLIRRKTDRRSVAD